MITIDKTEILSQQESRDGMMKVIFTYTLSDGTTIGPIVEHRIVGENTTEFVESCKPLYEMALNQEPPDLQQEMLRSILSYDESVVKETLQIDDRKIKELQEKYISNEVSDVIEIGTIEQDVGTIKVGE